MFSQGTSPSCENNSKKVDCIPLVVTYNPVFKNLPNHIRMYVCIYVCMDRWMDGWMDGWVDRWMDG